MIGRGSAGLALALLAAAWSPLAVAQPSVPSAQTADTSRQILVMLRLSPDHYRPNLGYGGGYGDGLSASMRRRAATRIAHRYHMALVGDGWPMPAVGVDCFVMRIADGENLDSVIDQVSRDPAVSWSQPVALYRTRGGGRPTDPLFAAQPDAKLWHLAELHRIATGRGETVAVIDSKVDTAHPDLAGQFVANRDFVVDHPSGPEQHGTGIAGVIAAKAGNGVGIVGVAPDARLMALRACWQTGASGAETLCDTLSLARALQFAIEHHADVINLSLAGPDDRLLDRLIGIALVHQVAVVAAYDAKLPEGGFPASVRGVVAVTNQDMASLPAGVYVAPGRDVPTAQPGGKWFLVNGSSYSAAHVSGLIALVRQHRGAEAHTILVAARASGGAIDACASLLHVHASCGCACTPAQVASAGF